MIMMMHLICASAISLGGSFKVMYHVWEFEYSEILATSIYTLNNDPGINNDDDDDDNDDAFDMCFCHIARGII